MLNSVSEPVLVGTASQPACIQMLRFRVFLPSIMQCCPLRLSIARIRISVCQIQIYLPSPTYTYAAWQIVNRWTPQLRQFVTFNVGTQQIAECRIAKRFYLVKVIANCSSLSLNGPAIALRTLQHSSSTLILLEPISKADHKICLT